MMMISTLPQRLFWWRRPPWSYFMAILGIGAMTGLISVTHAYSSTSNVPMLYLLVVIASALFLGRSAAVLASVAAFLSFDYFFLSPRYQLDVQQPQEWVALFTFLLTAMVTGELTALLRARAEEAQRRKLETAALAEASWAVASELDREVALNKVLSKLAELVKISLALLISPDERGALKVIAAQQIEGTSHSLTDGVDYDVVKAVLSQNKAIGWQDAEGWKPDPPQSGNAADVYLPVVIENQAMAVLYLRLEKQQKISQAEMQLVDSLRNHAAVILQRDKLMKAEAGARALSEADSLKTALLSMVSHDFRSPLTSIKASVGSLLAEGAPLSAADQAAMLQGVIEETDRLDRMVKNILDLSRLDSGAWRPRKEPTAIAELVGAALDNFSPEENARIEVVLDKSLNEVAVDAVQMVQVLKNLLENALKYSPDDSKVEVRTLWGNGVFVLEVLDRGGGLPKGEEERIFERFYRAPGLTESAVPGVGIGLALCRGLVEANGGKLSAANRDGGGTSFCVSLPLNSAE